MENNNLTSLIFYIFKNLYKRQLQTLVSEVLWTTNDELNQVVSSQRGHHILEEPPLIFWSALHF
jgi:hypothetical protein